MMHLAAAELSPLSTPAEIQQAQISVSEICQAADDLPENHTEGILRLSAKAWLGKSDSSSSDGNRSEKTVTLDPGNAEVHHISTPTKGPKDTYSAFESAGATSSLEEILTMGLLTFPSSPRRRSPKN